MISITWSADPILKLDDEHWPEGGFPSRKDLKPGTAFWDIDGGHELEYVCPCGCGAVRVVPVTQAADRVSNDPRGWKWDGNLENPTLQPSIQIIGSCRWHGWLTAGIWQTC